MMELTHKYVVYDVSIIVDDENFIKGTTEVRAPAPMKFSFRGTRGGQAGIFVTVFKHTILHTVECNTS